MGKEDDRRWGGVREGEEEGREEDRVGGRGREKTEGREGGKGCCRGSRL